jgi:hypothetical protein
VRRLVVCLVLLIAPTAQARTVHVPSGGDLQTAIDRAHPGDTIALARGGTYVGPFTLPAKRGHRWITVRGARITGRAGPRDAAQLPDLLSPGAGQPAIRTAARAHHWRLQGLEIRKRGLVYDLVALGDAEQDRRVQVPHHLILDRVWVHGEPEGELKRGIALNSGHTRIVRSTVSDVGVKGQDSQAIGGWNGPGPFVIAHNRLQGAAENVMFGGAAPAIKGLTPSNITIKDNLIDKPLAWKGRYTVKNLFELKNALRVRIVHNVFRHNWVDGQVGIAIVLTPRGENGAAPWATVRDVRFERNVVTDSPGALNILGHDDGGPSRVTKRITIANNLFTRMGREALLKISGGDRIKLDHNTSRQQGSVIVAYGEPSRHVSFTNNVANHNRYGVFGDAVGTGLPALRAFFPGVRFAGNVLPGGDRTLYPLGNWFPRRLHLTRRGALPRHSPYRGRGTDGRDPGANIAALP